MPTAVQPPAAAAPEAAVGSVPPSTTVETDSAPAQPALMASPAPSASHPLLQVAPAPPASQPASAREAQPAPGAVSKSDTGATSADVALGRDLTPSRQSAPSVSQSAASLGEGARHGVDLAIANEAQAAAQDRTSVLDAVASAAEEAVATVHALIETETRARARADQLVAGPAAAQPKPNDRATGAEAEARAKAEAEALEAHDAEVRALGEPRAIEAAAAAHLEATAAVEAARKAAIRDDEDGWKLEARQRSMAAEDKLAKLAKAEAARVAEAKATDQAVEDARTEQTRTAVEEASVEEAGQRKVAEPEARVHVAEHATSAKTVEAGTESAAAEAAARPEERARAEEEVEAAARAKAAEEETQSRANASAQAKAQALQAAAKSAHAAALAAILAAEREAVRVAEQQTQTASGTGTARGAALETNGTNHAAAEAAGPNEKAEAMSYLEVEKVVGKRPMRKWQQEWVALNVDQAAIDGELEYAVCERYAKGGPESIEAKAREHADAIQWKLDAGWSHHDALAHTLISSAGVSALGRALAEKESTYAASTAAICDALASRARLLIRTNSSGASDPSGLEGSLAPKAYCNLRGLFGLVTEDARWGTFLTPQTPIGTRLGIHSFVCATASSVTFASTRGFGVPTLVKGRVEFDPQNSPVVCFVSRPTSEAMGQVSDGRARAIGHSLIQSAASTYEVPPLATIELEARMAPGEWEAFGTRVQQELYVVGVSYLIEVAADTLLRSSSHKHDRVLNRVKSAGKRWRASIAPASAAATAAVAALAAAPLPAADAPAPTQAPPAVSDMHTLRNVLQFGTNLGKKVRSKAMDDFLSMDLEDSDFDSDELNDDDDDTVE